MSKTKLIPKHKTGYFLDYDPTNPYHFHTNDGGKHVISPEYYEIMKELRGFENVVKAVEEHQTAYPSPEYTETPNPEYRRVYENVKAASNQYFKEHNFNGRIYREYSDVPEEYFGNSLDGVVTDKQGNLYRPMNEADAGRGVTPMFTTTERGHNGTYYDKSWVRVKTPEKTIKTLKQPLPVDKYTDIEFGSKDILNAALEYQKTHSDWPFEYFWRWDNPPEETLKPLFLNSEYYKQYSALHSKRQKFQNGGPLFQNGVNRIQKLITKKINDRVPGHEGELSGSPTDRTETFNSSVIPIYLSAIQSYKENDDNYVERLYDFYQDAITNPNSEEIVQNYKNITNRQYGDNSDYAIANNIDFIADNIRDFAPVYLAHEDAKSKYLGFPQRGNTVIESEYKPSKAKEQNTKYFKFKYQTPSYWSKVIKDMVGHNIVTKQYSDSILNTFTAERGVDPNKGEYISIYDIWDYNTNVFGGGKDNIGKYINGTPFEIYDRIYLDDYHNVNTSPESGTYYGRWLPEVKIIDYKNNKNNES